MRLSSLLRALPLELAPWLLLTSLCSAISYQSVTSPTLDLSQLGRVALAGNFDSISLYQFIGQSENALHTNGSQALFGRYPSGAFAQLESADGDIHALCPFVMTDGTLAGIIVAGNFTSIGGQRAQAAALYNPTDGTISPLPGLNGQLQSVYCDQELSTVYFGGSFTGANSSNAIAWTTDWTNLPFSGFNGPVGAVTKLPNGNIAFGGSFTGLGNTTTTPNVPDAQVVNVGSASISASVSTSTQGYNNPSNIICKTDQNTGPGNSWLLPENTPGYWQAQFPFGFEPTKLRLYNSKVPNFAAKAFTFVAFPINGIMNFTYTDPTTGELSSCSNGCLLPEGNLTYQDFYFANVIGMDGFQIQINQWYGDGGGLGGIELFQNDIYSFAIPQFNEPVCDDVSNGANATSIGVWTTEPAGQSSSGYLSTYLPDGTDSSPPEVSVIFQPDIKQAGNYSIVVYTPGCISDNTCSSRGMVNITGQMGMPTGTAAEPLSTQLFQTNDYDKYDLVYNGYLDANSPTFRPTVTLTPAMNQARPLTVVAQRIRFDLMSSNGGLNGLYEFNPNTVTVSKDFSSFPLDYAGVQLESGAQINALAVANNITFVGGSFSSENVANVMAVANGNISALPGGGLDESVQAFYYDGSSKLYVGGNFTNTRDNTTTGLSSLASYSLAAKTWAPLGAGVNGIVTSILPITVNISSTEQAECLAISGDFDQVTGFGKYAAFTVENIALWVPSANNWLKNINKRAIFLSGRLNAQSDVPGSTSLYAGAVESQDFGISGVAGLTTTGPLEIEQLPIDIESLQSPNTGSKMKRDTTQEAIEGVVTGLFYENGGLNITILGGHFSAVASNGSMVHNLALINNSNSDTVTGLTSQPTNDSAVLALATSGTTLIAGGSIPNGIMMYDLAAASLSSSQPPPLSGKKGVVYAITTQPNNPDIYVGGSFTSAGSYFCPALCIYNSQTEQWIAPFTGLSDDSEIATLTWASNTKLIVTGSLKINGVYTTVAYYDATGKTFTPWQGAGDTSNVPGPVTALTPTSDQYNEFWVSGTATNNGSSFISRFDGNAWTSINGYLGPESLVLGLQILGLTQSDGSNNLIDSDQTLLVSGQLNIAGVGNVSAALFNGTGFTPFVLSTLADGTPGSIQMAIVQNPQNMLNIFSNSLALGFVVLIALAIALALIFLLVVAGIIAERVRRRREGYAPAPTRYFPASDYEKKAAPAPGIPPLQLFSGLGGLGHSPPRLEKSSRPGTANSAFSR